MENKVAGVVQECFAKGCHEAAIGDPPLFCEKHEKMIPDRAILWLRKNHCKKGELQSRKWVGMILRAVAKIIMEENKEGLTTVITRMAKAMEREKDGDK